MLNHTIGTLLVQELSIDTRNISTFLAAVVGLLASQEVSLCSWLPMVPWNICAQSCIRRFSRWLSNSAIIHDTWYTVIFRHAIRDWSQMPIFLALDTTMLYDSFCCVRLSMIYLNRAIPVSWIVLEHNSSSVKYEQYAHIFDQAKRLLPRDVDIFLLADRGFVSRKLMLNLQTLHWHWRIRIKSNQNLLLKGQRLIPKTLPLSQGKALLFSKKINFGRGLERLSLSAGWARGCEEAWYILSADEASTENFIEYGRRFDIEEGFKDEKSGGFDLEASHIRDAEKLERLILVIAVASIIAVSEGVSVVLNGKREKVDAHKKRGLSYFQIGLRWILNYLSGRLKEIFCFVELKSMNDPLPAAPTEKESRRRRKRKDPAYLFSYVQHYETLP